MSKVLLSLLILVVFTGSAASQMTTTCTWLFTAFEGVPLTTFLPPNWNGTNCPGLLSFVPQGPVPAGFAFPNIHSPNFTFTPPIGQNNYQLQVSVSVTCAVVLKWCNPGTVYFWVYPSGLTPAPTAAPSTAAPTPAPTAVPTPQPTPLPPGQTQGPTSVPPTASPPTPIPTPIPTPQLPVTCQFPQVAYSYITQPVRLNILAGVQNCVAPSLVIAQDPTNPALGLWSVNTTDSNTLYFDASGQNTVQAIFSVNVQVQCGTVTYCNLTQQLIVSAPLTPAPTPAPLLVPDCPPAYGFQGFYGQSVVYSLSTQDFAYQCSAAQGNMSFVMLSNTTLGAVTTFDAASGNFTYIAPTTVAIDKFAFSVFCGSVAACNGQAFIVTTMNLPTTTAAPLTTSSSGGTNVPPGLTTPSPPVSSALPTPVPLGTNSPQWQPCPGASPFIFPFFRNADQSFSLQSANLLTGVNLTYGCMAYSNVTLLSSPAVGQLAGFDAQKGQFWYTTTSAVNGWDNFTFALSCASPTPFTCVATAMIIVFPAPNAPTPAPTPMPTLPVPFSSINQGTIQCRGTCDSDAWKSTDLYPNMFDVTPDFMGTTTQVTPRKDGNPLNGASYGLSPTANNVVLLTFYTKIGNMAARFPTFVPFDVADRTPFNASAVAGTGAAFNASCLNLQQASGVAYGMWSWDDPQLRNLSGRIVNNSYYSRGNDYFQKFGGKHKSCDAFLSNSCQYAPMLTPNIPTSASSSQQNNYVNWTLTVDDCDATWVGSVTLDSIKTMTYPNGTSIFTRTGPKQLTGLMYSEVIKPKKWLRGSSGTMSMSTAIPISLTVRTYLTAGTAQVDLVAPVAQPPVAAGASSNAPPPPLTTNAPQVTTAAPPSLFTTAAPPVAVSPAIPSAVANGGPSITSATAAPTSAPTIAPSLFTTSTGSGSGGSQSSFTTSAAISTASIVPQSTAVQGSVAPALFTTSAGSSAGSLTTAAPSTTAALVLYPQGPQASNAFVNVSVDVEYSITANPLTNERQYFYNVLLFPSPANFSSSLFVSNVQLVSVALTSPAASQCSMCTGNVSTCTGMGNGFVDSCGTAALVTFSPNPVAPVWCPNTTAPFLTVPGVAGPRSCPQKLFNVSFFGTVSGANSASIAGQPEGTIAINVTLSNGQVFQIQLAQRIYISQASSNPDLGVTINRPTMYYPVADPFGVSLPTKPWSIPKPEPAPSDWGYPVASSTQPVCLAAYLAPTIDYFSSLPNGAASMTDQPDARIFGPSDWVFTQINTNLFPNATLNFMTLTVDAIEVVPSPSQQQFSFILAGSNPPPASQAQGGVYLDWTKYASFISFRAIDSINGSRSMQFGLVPGALLRTGCSNTVIFKLEASVSVGSASYFIRLLIPVSQDARRNSGSSSSASYYAGLVAAMSKSSTASNGTWIIFVLVAAALVFATFAGAAYYDKTLLPGLALQFRILLGALHLAEKPVVPEPPPTLSSPAMKQTFGSAREGVSAASTKGDGQRGAAPPTLSTVSSSAGAPPLGAGASTNRKASAVSIGQTGSSSPAKFGVIQEEALPRRDDEEA